MTVLGVPADLTIYLLLVQTLPLIFIKWQVTESQYLQHAIALQILLFLLFWLVWGGYSIDAWRYLTRFDRDPLRFEEEQLFWMVGHGLGRVLLDPWPLKVLSAIAAGLFAYATAEFLKRYTQSLAYYGLFLIPLLPAFYLTFGNAIRQGLAASIVMVGLVRLQRGQLGAFLSLGLIAFFFHQTSFLLVLAALLGRFQTRRMPLALLLAPLMSFIAYQIAAFYGVNLSEHIRYADYDEGAFHWAKFVVAYGLAWVLWWVHDENDAEIGWLTASYGYMVAVSSLLLRYEVPFERMLLYSEFLLPALLVLTLFRRKILVEHFVRLWAVSVILGLALWTHPSIVSTLGY